MSVNIIELTAQRLGPVHRAIGEYDALRPLNDAARGYQGLPGALKIVEAEVEELVELRRDVDTIPLEKLNGQRKMMAHELGDVIFGLAEVFKYLHIEDMSREQAWMIGQWCTLAVQTEQQYGLDLVRAGVGVNYHKNPDNNPRWAFREYHPLDNKSSVIDRNDWVRRGLRRVRAMDPSGKLVRENMSRVMDHFGYTVEVLKGSPPLALAFLTRVAMDGVGAVR